MIAPCGSDVLVRWAGCDATEAFLSAEHSASAQSLLNNFCVGMLAPQELVQNERSEVDENICSSAFIASARDKCVTVSSTYGNIIYIVCNYHRL